MFFLDQMNLIKNYSMLSQVLFQIVGKLAETITANRTDPKASTHKPHNPLLSSVSSSSPAQPSLTSLLSDIKGKYNLKQKLQAKAQSSKNYRQVYIRMIFSLIQENHTQSRDIENWTICATQKNNDSLKGEVAFVGELFEDVINTLGYLPFHRTLQKEREQKTRHFFNHKFFFQPPKYSLSSPDLRNHHLIVKQSENILVEIKVDFNPHFLFSSSFLRKEDSGSRKISTTSSEQPSEKNVSVYAFYDKELDLTFLSSEQQSFEFGSEEIKMEYSNAQLSQLDEEYELLIEEDHREFLEANSQIFDFLIREEKQYMQQ